MNRRGYKHRNFIISLLLMMVFAQAFSMHYHVNLAWDEPHSQTLAHSHAIEDVDHDHSLIDHDGGVAVDTFIILLNYSVSLGLLLFVFILPACLALPINRNWQTTIQRIEWRYLHFFNPPLRAPPL